MAGTKKRRMNRIFAEDGRSLVVALDHAAFYGPSPGLQDPGELIRQVRRGGADAILTSYGISRRFADEIGGAGLILRVDGGVTWLAGDAGPLRLVYDVQAALRLGADAVGCMGMPGSRYESETLPYLSHLVAECAEWEMPVMAEMLPGGFEDPARFWTPERIGMACRVGAELGADFVKTAFTGDVASFRQIVQEVYVPILVLGGSRAEDPGTLLAGVHAAMEAGASGVAIGRNIHQHPQPQKMTAAIAAIVHGGATVGAALEHLK